MRSLVVGGTPYQTTHLSEWLEKLGHDVTLCTLSENLTVRPGKSRLSLNIAEAVQRALFFGESSLRGFSHYFFFFHQLPNLSRKPVRTIILLLIGFYGRRYPAKSRRIREFLDQIRLNFFNTSLDYDYVFFTGNLSTSTELRIFYAACGQSITTVYTPYNWDTPFGKLYRPTCGFSYALAWGEQMKVEMQGDDNRFFGAVYIFPAPRLKYLTRVSRRETSEQFVIFAAPSLKPNSEMLASLRLISKVCSSLYGRPRIILRPHPFSFDWSAEVFDQALREYADFELDAAYVGLVSDFAVGTFKDRLAHLESTLIKNFEIADLVVTEAGTLTAEALAGNLRVISLVNNYRNKTLRVHSHFDHYNFIMNDPRVLHLFSLNGAEEKVRNFLCQDFRKLSSMSSALPDVIDFNGWNNTPGFLV